MLLIEKFTFSDNPFKVFDCKMPSLADDHLLFFEFMHLGAYH